MQEEIWKDVTGYEGLYQVSSYSRIRSLDRIVRHSDTKTKKIKGVILKNIIHGSGYVIVSLLKNSIRNQKKLHRLIAIEFIENKQNKPQINHIDGVKTNNSISNLEWCTAKENVIHKFDCLKYVSPSRSINYDTLIKIKNELLDYKYGDVSRIAKKYGIGISAISKIKVNKQYKH